MFINYHVILIDMSSTLRLRIYLIFSITVLKALLLTELYAAMHSVS